ncbi:MAG TPA: hypothetical protein P5277_02585 [Candidatus Paceibacterota bacterium]|nr:hypothetical protein [Candidatus Paceibacterota bacterium]
MRCILCEEKVSGNSSVKTVCKDCVRYIANKAQESGAVIECFADAVIMENCPNLTFPEFSNGIVKTIPLHLIKINGGEIGCPT